MENWFQRCIETKEEDIQRALMCMNPENLVLNSKTHEVFLTQPGMEIDLGAIVKAILLINYSNTFYLMV